MSSELFLSLENEQSLLFGERIVFCVSSLLNIAALFCLSTKTPPNQSKIKNYLIFIQVAVIATDFYFSVLFEPFPVLQVFAGYCVGILCRYFSAVLVTGIYAFLVVTLSFSIIMCVIQRHQTIFINGNWAFSRVGISPDQGGRTALNILVVLIFYGPLLVIVLTPFKMDSDEIMKQSSVNVSWMEDRGAYFMLERKPVVLMLAALAMAQLIVCVTLGLIIFAHMFFMLHRQSGRSAMLKRSIRISLIRLFVQLEVPIFYLVNPISVLFLEMIFDCFSFEFCLFAIFTLPFHSIMHNITMFSMVPAYRTYFSALLPTFLTKRGSFGSAQLSLTPTVKQVHNK